MKYDVFISYSSKDQKMVEAICAYLEQRRIRCFVAYRDIPKGVSWAERIVEALDESGMMLVAFTENFNASNEVNREIELACNDKKPILTFRLSDTAFAGAKKYFLQNLNWLDAFPEPEPVFGEMYRNVCGLLGKKPEEPSYIEDGSSDCAADVEDSADGLPDTGECKKDDEKKNESPDSESGNNDVRLPEGTKSVKNFVWIILAFLLVAVFGYIAFLRGNSTPEQPKEVYYIQDSMAIASMKRQFEDSIAKIKYEQFRKDSIAKQTRLENERKQREAERIAAESKRKETERIAPEKHKKQQLQAKKSIINAHEAIDLGLPSGIKWAACNVGANSPEEYGGYYAWGETEEKSNYDWSTYKWCNGSENSVTKYCTDSDNGTVDNKTVLDPEDDVAHVKWSGSWRMPTSSEQEELRNNCTWIWTTQNGVNGYRVTGSNGNSIFLPAAGYRKGTDVNNRGKYGYYRSSSSYSYNSTEAFFLCVFDYCYSCYSRRSGLSVRPVSE